MKPRFFSFLQVVALLCLIGSITASPDKIPPELIGTWNWKSLTALKNGKPFGTVNFRSGQAKTTFNLDGTWVVDTTVPTPHQLNGSYEVRGHDLEMKRSDGTPYATYQFKIANGGKELWLQGGEQRIVASRE